MWARAVEVMLGMWLAISPFVFGYGEGQTVWWVTDFVAAILVWTLSLSSFWHRTYRAHLGLLIVAAWLVGYAYFAGGHPAPPVAQNHLLVGLLLAMIAIIPSHNEKPPVAWQAFYERGEDRG